MKINLKLKSCVVVFAWQSGRAAAVASQKNVFQKLEKEDAAEDATHEWNKIDLKSD